jgi:hypothetical protein
MRRGELKYRRLVAVNSDTVLRSIVIENLPPVPEGFSKEGYYTLLALSMQALMNKGVQFMFYNEKGLLDVSESSTFSLLCACPPQPLSIKVRKDDDTKLVIDRESTTFLQKMMSLYYENVLRGLKQIYAASIDNAVLLAIHLLDTRADKDTKDFMRKQTFKFQLQNKILLVGPQEFKEAEYLQSFF